MPGVFARKITMYNYEETDRICVNCGWWDGRGFARRSRLSPAAEHPGDGWCYGSVPRGRVVRDEDALDHVYVPPITDAFSRCPGFKHWKEFPDQVRIEGNET